MYTLSLSREFEHVDGARYRVEVVYDRGDHQTFHISNLLCEHGRIDPDSTRFAAIETYLADIIPDWIEEDQTREHERDV